MLIIVAKAWIDRIAERPQVKAGRDVPSPAIDHTKLSEEEKDKLAMKARSWIVEEKK